MIIKEYDFLPIEAKNIRIDVFVNEQKFVDEFDEIDNYAKHFVMFEKDTPIATCRIYYNTEKASYVIGRIAVIKSWRGKNIGSIIIKYAEEVIYKAGGKKVMLSSQVRASGFYEKQGYSSEGESYLEEYCPHIWMKKSLETLV